jgi:hypothetical protein
MVGIPLAPNLLIAAYGARGDSHHVVRKLDKVHDMTLTLAYRDILF